jgi:hypothetical protein
MIGQYLNLILLVIQPPRFAPQFVRPSPKSAAEAPQLCKNLIIFAKTGSLVQTGHKIALGVF